MKKSLFLATAGFAGLLLGTPQNNAQAEVNLNINIGGPRYVGNYGPDFIYLDDYGFAVSWGWDYDVIRLGNFYFIYRDGGWFRSPNYRGPWARVRYWDLPYQLRRYSWNDIRRRRDREYRRYDRAYWDRHFRDQRARYGDGPFYAGDYGPDFIYLDDYGFSVSWGWDYDVIWFGNYYFIYRDGGWFRSANHRGPWAPVRYLDIPYQIRRHDWNDIRRRRDSEYRKHDKTFWDRRFEEQRIRDRRDDRDRKFDGRPDGRPDFRNDDGQSGGGSIQRPDGRPDFRPDGRPDFRSGDGQPGGGNIQRLDGKPDLKPLTLPQTPPPPQPQPQGQTEEKPRFERREFQGQFQGQPQGQPQGQTEDKPRFERREFQGQFQGQPQGQSQGGNDQKPMLQGDQPKGKFDGKPGDNGENRRKSDGKSDQKSDEKSNDNPEGGWINHGGGYDRR